MSLTCSPAATFALLTSVSVFTGFLLTVALGMLMGRMQKRGKA